MSQPPIALQLWSVRDQLDADFEGTIRKVADLGFAGVETAFGVESNIDEGRIRHIAGLLSEVGLEVCSAHVELPLGKDRDQVLRIAETLGTKEIIWHGWPEDPRYGTQRGMEELIDEYSRANEVARSEGYEFGIHNHWWEVQPVEGQLPLEVLHRVLDPSIFFELDIYWCTLAGVDPVELISRLGNRVRFAHIKDGAAVDVDAPMLPLGQGTVKLEPTLAAIEGAAWWVVEFDAYDGDIFDALDVSLRYLRDREAAARR